MGLVLGKRMVQGLVLVQRRGVGYGVGAEEGLVGCIGGSRLGEDESLA